MGGRLSTVPLTATRPASIHFSASRREQSPAWAMALAMRMGSGARIGSGARFGPGPRLGSGARLGAPPFFGAA
ncbi:hypothetical protein AUC69_01415 [Methyloceanibacter superfactus]|uniref:Uncharacterized protein n=1 Tax=Methyloceanibacter superfactus TaxID=1774969 RepID=A0A1E3VW96_9HYPH|nr:hypothetical protein AUC69_01415 [Methyloceanibacter superfactus]